MVTILTGCVLCEARVRELKTENIINPAGAHLNTLTDEIGAWFALRTNEGFINIGIYRVMKKSLYT
jgi:hypothetical protein